MVHMQKTEDSLWKSCLSFYRGGPVGQTQAVRLDSGHLHSLRYLTGPQIILLLNVTISLPVTHLKQKQVI